jgi:hypothetical protein
MTSTTPLPHPDMPGLAKGYGPRVPGSSRSVEPFVDIEAERPAGNLASNVKDLARFVSLQFRSEKVGGSQILIGSTLQEMHRVHWLRKDWKSGWGLGYQVRRVDEETRVGHGGSLPGHRSALELVPDKKLGVIVLTNANDGNPKLYRDKAFEIVGPAIAHATKPSEVASKPDPEWEQYVGVYTWKNSDIEIMILNGKLTLIVPEDANPWKSRITLEPLSQHKFLAIPAKWHFSLNGEILTFEFDSAGQVIRLSCPNFYWIRK